jgi:hypothetical protein
MLQTTEGKRKIHEMNANSIQKHIDLLSAQVPKGKPPSKELVDLNKKLAAEKNAIQQMDAEKEAVNSHFDLIQARWRIAKARHESLNPKIAPSVPVSDTFLLLSPTPPSPKPDDGVAPIK